MSDNQGGSRGSAFAKALTWLRAYTDEGPKSADSAKEDAEDAGISLRTLERAKRSLKIEVQKFNGVRMWVRPSIVEPSGPVPDDDGI
jgi:hypothetical protein